ncbi:Yip4p [Lachancea thermotolerans CBS 6340]|uniref:KLTH0E06358p n=1 Tax=Lachancea thermotolerans (strain ATCC 56472 / CBS 6340 / NRRL Y-8284) TaxID=559295 RepID=C5DHQ9_LACTC|nr:KLTH0E06358p [Lachancea thermotolerans CBS 6340]CAR23320.1 KLTH0E06358p [Lachancea thermotolerans CBS 6340]
MSDLVEPDLIENDRSQSPFWPESNASPNLDGYNIDLNARAGESTRGTLDEPVFQTLKRDVLQINTRLKQVVYPHFPLPGRNADTSEISDPAAIVGNNCTDLWAPLVFTILYAVALSRTSDRFSGSFILSWAAIIAMAIHLTVTRSESVSNGPVLTYVSSAGYCLFPQVLNAVLSAVLFPLATAAIPNHAWKVRVLVLLRLFSFVTCSFWACRSSFKATAASGRTERFPLLLLQLTLGWACMVT